MAVLNYYLVTKNHIFQLPNNHFYTELRDQYILRKNPKSIHPSFNVVQYHARIKEGKSRGGGSNSHSKIPGKQASENRLLESMAYMKMLHNLNTSYCTVNCCKCYVFFNYHFKGIFWSLHLRVHAYYWYKSMHFIHLYDFKISSIYQVLLKKSFECSRSLIVRFSQKCRSVQRDIYQMFLTFK